MNFTSKMQFRGCETFTTKKGTFIRYYFENENGKGFQFVSKNQYKLEKGKDYLLDLQTNELFLLNIKGV